MKRTMKSAKRQGPGRPRLKVTRRNRVSVQYTDAELAILERAAGDLRVSEHVRLKSLA